MSKPKSPRKVGEREALAVATSIRGSAYKLNLVAGLIRGRKVGDALNILQFSTKAMARRRASPASRRRGSSPLSSCTRPAASCSAARRDG
jgi:ribosomal protein L22